jgi:site-specific DNA-methyltransferase (adenine-specific)
MIFLLSPTVDYSLDRMSIAVPYEDKSNVGRYSETDAHCRGNVWRVGYETITDRRQKWHPDRFPVELVELGIKLSGTKPGGVMLDPFMGSGTSLIAGTMHGLKVRGFEVGKRWYQVSLRRYEAWLRGYLPFWK